MTLVQIEPLARGTGIWHRVVWLVGVKVWRNLMPLSSGIKSVSDLLACGTAWSCSLVPAFRGAILPPTSGDQSYCFLWFISLCCPVGGQQHFGGRSCVCPQG